MSIFRFISSSKSFGKTGFKISWTEVMTVDGKFLFLTDRKKLNQGEPANIACQIVAGFHIWLFVHEAT